MSEERLLQMISDHHDAIVRFARDSFSTVGRGLIQVEFPRVSPGQTYIAVMQMKYVDLQRLMSASHCHS